MFWATSLPSVLLSERSDDRTTIRQATIASQSTMTGNSVDPVMVMEPLDEGIRANQTNKEPSEPFVALDFQYPQELTRGALMFAWYDHCAVT